MSKPENNINPMGFKIPNQPELVNETHYFEGENHDVPNKYLEALMLSFREFIDEEVHGCFNPEVTLKEKILAARTLFSEDRRNLKNLRR